MWSIRELAQNGAGVKSLTGPQRIPGAVRSRSGLFDSGNPGANATHFMSLKLCTAPGKI